MRTCHRTTIIRLLRRMVRRPLHSHYSYSRTTNINVNRRTRVALATAATDRLRTATTQRGPNNLYNRRNGRNADRGSRRAAEERAAATGKANNVFADEAATSRARPAGWSPGSAGLEKPEAADVRQRVDSKDLNGDDAVGEKLTPQTSGRKSTAPI